MLLSSASECSDMGTTHLGPRKPSGRSAAKEKGVRATYVL